MKKKFYLLVVSFTGSLVFFGGCHPQEKPPASAYDPALIEAAQEAAAERKAADEESADQESGKTTVAECTRQEGGCKRGYICWDSYYCKLGFADQCSASGDKRCHKLCMDDGDCPQAMPHCRLMPIFSGTERGVEEKFCVRKRD
jgi:hypothetical protein